MDVESVAAMRAAFFRRVADGDDGLGDDVFREVQDSCDVVFIEGSYPAAAESLVGGEEEDVFDSGGRVLDHVEAGASAAVGGDALGVGADHDEVGCLGDEGLVEGGAGELYFDLGVFDDDEVAGLEVAGGGCEMGEGDDVGDGVFGDGVVVVGADADAFVDGVGEVHGRVVSCWCVELGGGICFLWKI